MNNNSHFKYIILFGFSSRKLNYLSEDTINRNQFSPPPIYYINRIFHYLREHMELTKNREYKRLYKETLDYLIRDYYEKHQARWWQRRNIRKMIEKMADLNNLVNADNIKKFTQEQVDDFLTYRRIMWY